MIDDPASLTGNLRWQIIGPLKVSIRLEEMN